MFGFYDCIDWLGGCGFPIVVGLPCCLLGLIVLFFIVCLHVFCLGLLFCDWCARFVGYTLTVVCLLDLLICLWF